MCDKELLKNSERATAVSALDRLETIVMRLASITGFANRKTGLFACWALMGLAIGSLASSTAAADSIGPPPSNPPAKVDFNRDIRPILSDNCFACHGLDTRQRKANLRLDRKEDATRDREGHAVIVPGDVDASELVARIESDDRSLLMPPPKSTKSLKPEQIALLKRWIAEGAAYADHWAYIPPSRPALPQLMKNNAWARTAIDAFILARLQDQGLSPEPEADKTTLIRRLSLDLTGLPPTPTEVDAFLADSTPNAYETVVDRLLDSPRYGEHMARFWLDLARYGDTHGLHLDNYREMWPYRDWVIKAFNGNLPFDRFVTEQLAGDMLPNATTDQIVASGFNRCHITTSEGGSIAEEVYVRNVVDRVDTTGTVFLGLTIGCSKCHDHKYDPIAMKDYYSLFAIFNSLDDNPLDGNAAKYPPIIQVPSVEQKVELAKLNDQAARLDGSIKQAVTKAAASYDLAAEARRPEYVERSDYVWFDDALPPGAKPNTDNTEGKPFDFVSEPDGPVHSGKTSVLRVSEGLSQHLFMNASPGLKVGEGDRLFTYVFLDPVNPPKELMLQFHTDTWKARAFWGEDKIDYGKAGTTERQRIGDLPITGKWVRLEVDAAKLGLTPGTMISGWAFTQFGGAVYWDKVGIETYTPQPGQSFDTLTAWIRGQKALKGEGLPKPLQDILKLPRGQRKPEQTKDLLAYYLENASPQTSGAISPLRQQLVQTRQAITNLNNAIPTTLVSQERKEPKPAFLLDRGEYDRQRDKVSRSVPGFLPPLPPGANNDRLGFAKWLLDARHPLTARVAVNRFWAQFFGIGLVKTTEDFGVQGEPPSHPELLDWLAVEFREKGWNIKALIKEIVMSATYRQNSRVTPEKLASDRENRLLARGPRYRLDAEMLRDQALFQSGLLVERVGGPSVKPPQPAGLWEAVGYTSSNTARFVADTGPEKVFRRSFYIFWKRTSPPPQMTTFDAPSREACVARRERTNTPLQALLLMNEPQYVEAARSMAQRAIREGGTNDDDRLTYLFRLATARRPVASELAELKAAHAEHLAHFQKNPEAAKQLINQGETKPDGSIAPEQLAALAMLANLVMNLDEAVTKE